MKPAEPKRYVIQKHVMAATAAEALAKESETPVSAVFLDTSSETTMVTDAIGFKYLPEQ